MLAKTDGDVLEEGNRGGPGNADEEQDELWIPRDEVENAIKPLEVRKTTGSVMFPAQLLKCDGTVEALYRICNLIWKTGKRPSQWLESLMIVFSKKGDLRKSVL